MLEDVLGEDIICAAMLEPEVLTGGVAHGKTLRGKFHGLVALPGQLRKQGAAQAALVDKPAGDRLDRALPAIPSQYAHKLRRSAAQNGLVQIDSGDVHPLPEEPDEPVGTRSIADLDRLAAGEWTAEKFLRVPVVLEVGGLKIGKIVLAGVRHRETNQCNPLPNAVQSGGRLKRRLGVSHIGLGKTRWIIAWRLAGP